MKQDKIYGLNFNRILTGGKRNCLPHPCLTPACRQAGQAGLAPLPRERGKEVNRIFEIDETSYPYLLEPVQHLWEEWRG